MRNPERYRRFPEINEGMTAIDAYTLIHPEIPYPRSEAYLTRPITSSLIEGLNEQFTFDPRSVLILKVNQQISELAAGEIELLIGERLSLSQPLTMSELRCSQLSLFFISGIDIYSAGEFEKMIEEGGVVKIDVFNDYHAEKEERRKEYQKLAMAFMQFTRKSECYLNPVSRVVLLPGHERFLGCGAERTVAKSLGISTVEAVFNQNHPRFGKDVIDGILGPLVLDEPSWRQLEGVKFPIPTVREDGGSFVVLREI